MLFYKTYYEESNINRKLIIRSQDNIITKLGQKELASLDLANLRKMPKNEWKKLFDETLFKESNTLSKPCNWSQDKIITKFGEKKMDKFGFG